MVQFQHEFKTLSSDYWKLDSGTRTTKNTKDQILEILTPNDQYLKSRSISRIRELYVRHQRGLISYEKVTVRELRSFAMQRGLTSTSTAKPTKAILKAQLEQADDDATFDRFSGLPPELRRQIYKQYFASFDESPKGASEPGGQPPITLVSKQTRLEALPLFYSCYRFRFSHIGRSTATLWYKKLFVHSTLVDNFARIRFLELSRFRYEQHYHILLWISISINLNDDECSTKISEALCLRGFENVKAAVDRVNGLLMLEPHSFVRSIAAREGWRKLQKSDLPVLHGMLKDAVQRASLQAA